MNINKAFTELAEWCDRHDACIAVSDGNLSFFFKDKQLYNSEFFYSLTFDKYTKTVRQWDTVAIASKKEGE